MSGIGSQLRRRGRVFAATVVGAAATLSAVTASAGGDSEPPAADEPGGSVRCIVRLHGKSGEGSETYADGEVLNVLPEGNAEGWGGRQWIYFPDDQYEVARSIVADAIEADGCGDVIVNGFSNGGAFAAKLYCRAETFDGRVVRFVVDDPVPDEAVLECAPDPTVGLVVYWTGALAGTAKPGWQCSEGDWTCEGGVTIGIDAYAEALGTDVQPSRYETHDWYWDAPELSDWTRPEPSGSVPESGEAGSTVPATTEAASLSSS